MPVSNTVTTTCKAVLPFFRDTARRRRGTDAPRARQSSPQSTGRGVASPPLRRGVPESPGRRGRHNRRRNDPRVFGYCASRFDIPRPADRYCPYAKEQGALDFGLVQTNDGRPRPFTSRFFPGTGREVILIPCYCPRPENPADHRLELLAVGMYAITLVSLPPRVLATIWRYVLDFVLGADEITWTGMVTMSNVSTQPAMTFYHAKIYTEDQ